MTAPAESPAAFLRRAADVLDDRVAALGDNRGPWYIDNEETRPYPQTISNIGVPYVVARTFDGQQIPPYTALYIAGMHPGVGRAFATVLRAAADDAEACDRQNDRHPDLDGKTRVMHHPMTIAAFQAAQQILKAETHG
ncbi:hypothetical protein QMK19_03470 [Streptomyces sp. H10-C2]|uniref:hypothetical protein n=1 Tax=unclassified Streptomyces TaxID=2593676 RepID=UPI0024BA89DA|nr:MULTISPECIES: hypothetical protein [unclassified Streptomyces]MDJ0342246.1 hypothetical protein [Streptomyces sp. PH10-H1]MDJ0368760.1 hypothetical protein [Streptomyces sp. H10-C2]